MKNTNMSITVGFRVPTDNTWASIMHEGHVVEARLHQMKNNIRARQVMLVRESIGFTLERLAVWAMEPKENFFALGEPLDEFVIFSDFIQVSVSDKLVTVSSQINNIKDEKIFITTSNVNSAIFFSGSVCDVYKHIRSCLPEFLRTESILTSGDTASEKDAFVNGWEFCSPV